MVPAHQLKQSLKPSSSDSSRRSSGEDSHPSVMATAPSTPATTVRMTNTNTTAASTPAEFASPALHAQSNNTNRKASIPAGTSTPLSQNQKELAEAEAKRRKIQRACDACRRKKIKCDGPMNSLSTSKCAHCQEIGLECTYVESAKRRGPPKGYLETLEQRCGRLERTLHQLIPSVDLNKYVGPAPDRDDFDQTTYQETLRSLQIPALPSIKPLPSMIGRGSSVDSSGHSPAGSASSPHCHVFNPPTSRQAQPNNNPTGDESEEEMHLDIARSMKALDVKDASWRYHGKASGAHLMRTFQALKYKDQPSGADVTNFLDEVNRNKRSHFWQIPEWELVIANEGIRSLDYSVWPEHGLDIELIDAYFEHLNIHLPLLNRVLFMRQYESGVWKTQTWFAKVCLMIFANGARFVDDDRVFWNKDFALTEEGKERLRSDRDGTFRYSAGWKYLHALLRAGRSLMQGPNLYEFQCHVLLCVFLQGSAVPHTMWLVSGVGLRSAQEIGIHIKSTVVHIDPVERALYNRAFWCLYHIDRINCAGIGRSVAIQDTDLDADYPIDVDDEYWETGNRETDFVQPKSAGISSVAAFVQTLKLDHILSATLRTIYAVNQTSGPHADLASQRAIVVELDSALNSWADGVPDDLRWDPTRSDYRLFQQSAVLYVHYYYCQILIHRPFIPTAKTRDVGSASMPSLAVCANASRSICNIIDVALRRGRQSGALPGRALHPSFMLPSWFATIIILINIYSGKQSPAERERAIGDVRKCIATSKEMELLWRQAGKMTDMMVELATEHDMPVATPPSHGEKRSHEDETPDLSTSSNRHSSAFSQACQDLQDPRPGCEFDEERLVRATSTQFSLPLPDHNRDGVKALAANYSNYLGLDQSSPRLSSNAGPGLSNESRLSPAHAHESNPGATLPPQYPHWQGQGNSSSVPYGLGAARDAAGNGSSGIGTPINSNNTANMGPSYTLNAFGAGGGAAGGGIGGMEQAVQSFLNQNNISTMPSSTASGPISGAESASGPGQGFYDNTSLGTQLFDLGAAGFEVPGQGQESDMWAQLFSDYSGPNIDWSYNQPGNLYGQPLSEPQSTSTQYPNQFDESQPEHHAQRQPQSQSQSQMLGQHGQRLGPGWGV